MLSDLFGNIFIVVLVALFVPGVFFFYVLFYRSVRLKKKIREIFSGISCVHKIHDVGDGKSPYMYHEGGSVIVKIKINECVEILIYQFVVSGQLNMKRYLVYVQANAAFQDVLYGKGHIYRECKAHDIYHLFRPINEIPNEIKHLSNAVEAVEVFNGVAYTYYKLNPFFGYFPMQDIHLMIKNSLRERH